MADLTEPRPVPAEKATKNRDLLAYLSILHAGWLATGPDRSWREIDGTLVFADVSGFTPLTERLARRGKVGAELLTDILNAVFRDLLDVAGGVGGDCLKFGGDALLLLFTGEHHARRGCAAAHSMLAALRGFRRTHADSGAANLNMSVGVHSDRVLAILAGMSHREQILAGPAVTTVISLQSLARAGQILVSPGTASQLDAADLGAPLGDGRLLRRAPASAVLPSLSPAIPQSLDPRIGIPVGLTRYLTGSHQDGEHRLAAIAFVQFGQTDRLLEQSGPAGLAAALDGLIDGVQGACAEHGVTFLATDVDKNAGKMILATGTPSASPDDGDRLLHALREILDTDYELPLRAGATRGRVFAVDLGTPERRTFTVIGDTVNLAARVMGHADWGGVIATQELLDRIRTDFHLTPLPPFAVKGKAKPVSGQVVGEVQGGRGKAGGAGDAGRVGDSPLIGRVRELAVMREALASAHEGAGEVVVFVGEPGIGKSKLVNATLALPHGLGLFKVEAGRYSLGSPYFALRRSLRLLVGAQPGAPAAEIETALRTTIETRAPDLLPWLPLIAVPLGLEVEDTSETVRLDPAFRQASLHNAMASFLGRLLSDPTLILIEDAHWLDAASSQLFTRLLTGIRRRPWAVLITRWDSAEGLILPGDDVTTVHLERLPPQAAISLAVAASGGTALPPGMVQELVERSGGNPLFLEQLMAAALCGSLTELPDSVEAVVASNIDTLAPDDRLLLREASVLGNRFPPAMLASMLGVPESRLPTVLRPLERFLAPDESTGLIRFRHGLVRDVAYEGLPFRRRRTLHERAAVVLEEAAGDHTEDVAELLSVHFHAAGRFRASWRYSRVAAARARRNAAPIEAAAFLKRSLEDARHLGDIGPDQQAEVAESLGDVWELAGRYSEADVAYRQSRRAARGDPLRQAGLCRKIGYLQDREGHYSQALRWFGRGFNELEKAPPDECRDREGAKLSTASGSAKLRQGRHVEAIPILEDAIRQADTSGERSALAHAYQLLDLAHSELGEPAPVGYSERAVAIYDELGDERGRANALNQMGISAYWQGRWDDAVGLYEQSADAARLAGALVEKAIFVNNIGEIRSDQGRMDEAEVLLEEAYAIWSGAGWRIGAAWALSNLGRAESRHGRQADAADKLGRARQLLQEIKADGMLLETEAREAERLVLAGEHASALELVAELKVRAGRLGGMANVVALLDRLEGYALCQSGQAEAGWERLGRALALSRKRGALYETALNLEALSRVARLVGGQGGPGGAGGPGRPGGAGAEATLGVEAAPGPAAAAAFAEESAGIFERLGVVCTPVVPLPGSIS